MKKTLRISITFVLHAATALFVFQQAALAQDHAAKVQQVLELAHKYRQFNGSALVAENGQVIYKGGFGLANMEWNIPNTPDTKFRLGSITKQFTAMLTLQLVEQGKLKLDGKLSDYLPYYRKDIGDKVTIHHLLTHTSGIPSYTSQPDFLAKVSRNPYKVPDFVMQFTMGSLQFEPGTKFSYNNSGYFLLGAIIERITGMSYDMALREMILYKLRMSNTGYDLHDPLIPKRASGYTKTPTGYTNAAYLDMSIPYAAGSMYSTVEDLYLWDQALYTDKLLTPQSKELMYKPFLQEYAYGWAVTKASFKVNDQPIPIITHGGGINGFATTIVRFPNEKHLIVILDNTGSSNLERLSDKIAKILYNQPYDLPKQSIAAVVEKTIIEKGIVAAVAEYRELKAKQPEAYDFAEQELNALGYRLMQTNKVNEALEIFKLNVEAYPQAFNTYDSLAEAYMTMHKQELAIQNYKKSLELNPKNTNAVDMLKRLEMPTAAKVDATAFDAYVGEYELAPGFVLRVFREGEKFMTQATGQNQIEIFAEPDGSFSPRTFPAKLTFIKDADGKVTSVKLSQGGRDTVGKKIK